MVSTGPTSSTTVSEPFLAAAAPAGAPDRHPPTLFPAVRRLCRHRPPCRPASDNLVLEGLGREFGPSLGGVLAEPAPLLLELMPLLALVCPDRSAPATPLCTTAAGGAGTVTPVLACLLKLRTLAAPATDAARMMLQTT